LGKYFPEKNQASYSKAYPISQKNKLKIDKNGEGIQYETNYLRDKN